MLQTTRAYAEQSRWTDPAAFADKIAIARAQVHDLPNIVSGLVLHPGLSRARGFSVPTRAEGDQDLRSLSEMLEVLLSRDAAPLDQKRHPEHRLFGVCRHYALFVAAILRAHGVPARLRAGFATYFTPGWAEDHWVCEYHDGARWKLLDAELGDTTRRQLGIEFEPYDVPRDRFLSAARTWLDTRRGKLDPKKVGIRDLRIEGLWFVAGSLLRDAAALNMQELQPWDVWGPTRDLEQDRPIEPLWLARFGELAELLSTEPQTLEAVREIILAYPWAALGNSVLSYRLEPVEVSLA